MALPRFQIHLSTAIMLMFVAGALILANVRLRVGDARIAMMGQEWCLIGYGFPFFALETETAFIPGTPVGAPSKGLSLSQKEFLENLAGPNHEFYALDDGIFFYPPPSGFTTHGVGIAIDIVFALAILLLAAILSEYIFRRGIKGLARKT